MVMVPPGWVSHVGMGTVKRGLGLGGDDDDGAVVVDMLVLFLWVRGEGWLEVGDVCIILLLQEEDLFFFLIQQMEILGR